MWGEDLNTSILKAKLEHLDQCCKTLANSEIGKIYFIGKDIGKILLRAIEKEEIYVAESEEGVYQGFIWVELFGVFGKYPYLHIIAIDEKFRGNGVGRYLIKYFEDVIAKNSDKVFLMVGDFNNRAKELYVKLGYREIGRLPDFYIEGVNEQLMMKIKH